jgi:hypothetical protein
MSSAMRSVAVALWVLLLFAGCASSSGSDTTALDLRIVQLPDEGFAVEERGAVSVAYEITVHNRSLEAMTLRSIEMRTTKGSPYQLRAEPATLDLAVEPGKRGSATFTMWSHSRSQRSKTKRTVWVNGSIGIETSGHTIKKAFVLSFREP